jgi:cysteine desulfurase
LSLVSKYMMAKQSIKEIYCDNAATTRTFLEVIVAMEKCAEDFYANPSSLHKKGFEAKEKLEESRKKVASFVNCLPEEIIFTSGGTESNNIALLGLAQLARQSKKQEIICSPFEHSCVHNTVSFLEQNGFKVHWLSSDVEGFINPDEVNNLINPNTLFVSVMHVNNETGSIQDIEKISTICREKKVFFHTDAVQSAGKLELDVKKLNLDLLSFSGRKLYGPKGVGVLYINSQIFSSNDNFGNLKTFPQVLFGGPQEAGIRPGTENLAAIVGLAKALEMLEASSDSGKMFVYEQKRLRVLQQSFIDGIESSHILKNAVVLNGSLDLERRVAGIVNISLKNIKGDVAALKLNLKNIYCSTGSACNSSSILPSRVIACLYPEDKAELTTELALNSLRFSFGRETDREDIDIILGELEKIVTSAR